MTETEAMKDPEFIRTKDKLKEFLVSMKHTEGAELENAKRDFKEVLAKANPLMIAMAEQELVGEGFSQDDLVSACDIHLQLFRESVESSQIDVPPDHPVARFQEDHRIILKVMEDLRDTLLSLKTKSGPEEAKAELEKAGKLVGKLLEAENHNVRQENTLFPLLERHGIEQPPAIMWMEHTEMKQDKKKMKKLLDSAETQDLNLLTALLENSAVRLLEKFASHTQKEQNILYKAALDVLSEEEWDDIREECDNLGYFSEQL